MAAGCPFRANWREAVRERLEQARLGIFEVAEMEAVRPVLETQAQISAIPALDEFLIERVKPAEGHHLFFYPFEGRLVHEGLAALFALAHVPAAAHHFLDGYE